MTHELREGRNQVHSSRSALNPPSWPRAWQRAQPVSVASVKEGRKEQPDMWNPKVLKKTEGSLRQREEEELRTSTPANSTEAGDVGNLDTNLLSRETQEQNPTSVLTHARGCGVLRVETLGGDLIEHPIHTHGDRTTPNKKPWGATHEMLRKKMGTEGHAFALQQHPHRWAHA